MPTSYQRLMLKFSILCVLLISLSACVTYTTPVSSSYTGPTATISDSFARQTKGRANFFYVKEVDGKPIANAISRSASASYGQGNNLKAVGESRKVEVREQQLMLAAQVYSAAPIAGMLNSGKNYTVEGTITFTPQANASYIVKGKLNAEQSLVWIEDIDGNIKSEIVSSIPTEQEELLAVVAENSSAKKDATPYERFINIASGESLETVKYKVGEPSNIIVHSANYFSGRPEMHDYEYDGLGTIRFVTHGNALFVERVTPEVAIKGDSDHFKKQLDTEGAILQTIAKQFFEAEDLSVEKQDLIAETIWAKRSTGDRYTADAVAWLCKVIGKNNNPRYKELMIEVAKTSSSKKISKYASEAAEALPNAKVDQFKIKSESKAEMTDQ